MPTPSSVRRSPGLPRCTRAPPRGTAHRQNPWRSRSGQLDQVHAASGIGHGPVRRRFCAANADVGAGAGQEPGSNPQTETRRAPGPPERAVTRRAARASIQGHTEARQSEPPTVRAPGHRRLHARTPQCAAGNFPAHLVTEGNERKRGGGRTVEKPDALWQGENEKWPVEIRVVSEPLGDAEFRHARTTNVRPLRQAALIVGQPRHTYPCLPLPLLPLYVRRPLPQAALAR